MTLSALLRCYDLAATRECYAALGFEVSAAGEDPLIVALEGAALLFTANDPWERPLGFSGTLCFAVRDVDAHYGAVRDKATLAWELQDMASGSREFAVVDCNGYHVAFQQADL